MISLEELLKEYIPTQNKAFNLNFEGFPNKDIYNISAPFTYKNKSYILGRVEERESEDSIIAFFLQLSTTKYQYDTALPTFNLQDPFFSIIDDEFIIGGVEIIKDNENNITSWKTVFYKGNDLIELKPFFCGPIGMKDIRLVQTHDKKILVFTRPQGLNGGRGKIGVTIINNLDELNLEVIKQTKLLPLFNDEQWGGSNAAYLLEDNSIGVLAHIARYLVDGKRQYVSISFELSYPELELSNLKIIATRNEFNSCASKRDDLFDVIFSGGLDILPLNKVNLYVGVSDAYAQYITLNNPFTKGIIK